MTEKLSKTATILAVDKKHVFLWIKLHTHTHIVTYNSHLTKEDIHPRMLASVTHCLPKAVSVAYHCKGTL